MAFEVFKDGATPEKQWRWRLRATNGEIVAQSEGYTRKADAERGVRDAVAAAFSPDEVIIKETDA